MARLATRKILGYLGENIRRGRSRLGLTQEAFAEAVEMDARLVQRLKRGSVNITVDTLVRIAAALEIGAYELLVPVKVSVDRAFKLRSMDLIRAVPKT